MQMAPSTPHWSGLCVAFFFVVRFRGTSTKSTAFNTFILFTVLLLQGRIYRKTVSEEFFFLKKCFIFQKYFFRERCASFRSGRRTSGVYAQKTERGSSPSAQPHAPASHIHARMDVQSSHHQPSTHGTDLHEYSVPFRA